MFFIYSNSIMYGSCFGGEVNGQRSRTCGGQAGESLFHASGICQMPAILYWNANQKFG